MVLLPTPLKAFTDVMPDVKWMLRVCAFHTFGWRCDHPVLGNANLEEWAANPAYPVSWPKAAGDAAPAGTVALTPAISKDVDRRLATIYSDLEHAGPFYPHRAVLEALAYWNIPIPKGAAAVLVKV